MMWYYAINNERLGAVTAEQVGLLISQGKVDANTPVWTHGMEKWVKLDSTDLRQFLPSQPSPPPLTVTGTPVVASSLQSLFRVFWICGTIALVLFSIAMFFFEVTTDLAINGEGDLASVTATAWSMRVGWVLLILGMLPFLASAVAAAVLLYRFWQLIQDGKARTTPGKAVGFMFIPFFNFYWVFVAFWGLAKDMNAYVRDHGVSAERVNEGVALAACILSIFGKMPLVAGAPIALGFLTMSQMKNCAVAIAKQQAQPWGNV